MVSLTLLASASTFAAGGHRVLANIGHTAQNVALRAPN